MPSERRVPAPVRVPFVRRCSLAFDDGRAGSAFIVNINVLGAYLAFDEQPALGQHCACRFSLPDSSRDVHVTGVVAWLNPRQQHPVHSLPPGFGLRFSDLSADDRVRIEAIVRDYAARDPSPG